MALQLIMSLCDLYTTVELENVLIDVTISFFANRLINQLVLTGGICTASLES